MQLGTRHVLSERPRTVGDIDVRICQYLIKEHIRSFTRVGGCVVGLHAMKMTNRSFSVRLPMVIGAGRGWEPGKRGTN